MEGNRGVAATHLLPPFTTGSRLGLSTSNRPKEHDVRPPLRPDLLFAGQLLRTTSNAEVVGRTVLF